MCNEHHDSKLAPTNIEGFAIASPKMHRRDLVRGLWAGTMLVGVSGAAGCADTAQFFAPSEAQLAPLAEQAWEQTKAETPISNDRAANALLQRVGPRIAQAAGAYNANWEFVVFDSEEKNAFVLPGGKVGFYKGLIDFADNEDQIAAVMGHETGHVTQRHAALRAGQQQATALGLALGSVAVGASGISNDQKNAALAVMGAGATVGIMLPFSRQNELEADIVGVDYMQVAGYDVTQAITLWQKMGAASQGRPTEWMSTHPNPETRIDELRRYINSRGYARV